MTYPSAQQVKDARLAAGLTQTEAARVIHATRMGWQKAERGERRMSPAAWDLFCRKAFGSKQETSDDE